MNGSCALRSGAILGGLGVALGAFGAHAMKDHFPAPALANWDTGVRYLMWHAAILCLCGLLADRLPASRALRTASWAFLGGIALFSGSLASLVLTEQRWLGAVTPFGGVLFLVGWVALAVAAGDLGKARAGTDMAASHAAAQR